mgnify:CR=1 FL=1
MSDVRWVVPRDEDGVPQGEEDGERMTKRYEHSEPIPTYSSLKANEEERFREALEFPSEQILQFFAWTHLPESLQEVSSPFQVLAKLVVDTLPRNPERTVALRKLLEAKDAAVRARLMK